MKRILLISPDKTPDRGGGQLLDPNLPRVIHHGPRGVMAPVELATLAALTPPEFEVDLWDEAVRGEIGPDTDLGADYDLMGVTGYLNHVIRMLQLRDEFHSRGVTTVAGGPAVSNSPERFRGIFDVIFLGEAEFTWPRFLREWAEGRHEAEYRQVQRPDLSTSPAPRWDKVQQVSTAYAMGGVQTTRGCPFDCEFCDVIHLFGRQPRHKPIDAVLQEIRNLAELGVKRVFFCDDDFIGRPKYTKELLRKLIPLNNSFPRPLGFMTQLTINVAHDQELLELMAEVNFWQLHIGIETPRLASLREVNKIQNTKGDLIEDVRRIQSYGIPVKALMMVGFDNDDHTIFDEIVQFVEDAHIATANVSLLQAFPGTPQTARLLKQGRVIDMDRYAEHDDTYGVSNVIPAKMTRRELFEGYLDMQARLRSWKSVGQRLLGMVRDVQRKPSTAQTSAKPDPSRLADLQQYVQTLDEEARAVATEVLRETFQRCPWMLPKVAYKLILQHGSEQALARWQRRLRKRIEIEAQPGYRHKILAAVQIPKDFKRLFKDDFVATFHHLHRELHDKNHVPEGLIRVWKDFVTRWGATFERFEDYHRAHLKELCERTVEQGNAGKFSSSRSVANVDGLSTTQIRQLADEVIFSVEQDLKGETGEHLVRLTIGTATTAAAV